jgi:uncharacterized radical SAM superfamily Fe-S cluster-containing enzyme
MLSGVTTAPLASAAGSKALKRTRTLCPACLKQVVGITFEHEGKVYLERTCPEHGVATALVSSDRRHYYLRGEVPHPPPSGGCCAPGGLGHRACVALLEITDACNLHCAACYAQSPNGKHRPFEELVETLERYLAKAPLDVLQISGGEPTIHPRFIDLVAYALARPDIRHVMVNTNGVTLARDPELSRALAVFKPRFEIYLQLDGLDQKSHAVLRGQALLEEKHQALARLAEHDIPTTFVATVVDGVNDGELGALLELGLSMPNVRGVAFQPATFAGRFTLESPPIARSTLASVLEGIEAQSKGILTQDDFRALPCSEPNCCSFTFLARDEAGGATPLGRLLSYEEHWPKLQDRMFFLPEDAGGAITAEMPPKQIFRVTVKPFMDAWTYDQARIDECCLHIIQPDGEPISFCEYNVRVRGQETLVPLKRRRPPPRDEAACCGEHSGTIDAPDALPADFDPS